MKEKVVIQDEIGFYIKEVESIKVDSKNTKKSNHNQKTEDLKNEPK